MNERTTLTVSNGFLLFCAGVLVGGMVMAKKRPPCPDKRATLPLPESDDSAGTKADNIRTFHPPLERTG